MGTPGPTARVISAGHGDVSLTLNVYSHVLPDMGDAAAVYEKQGRSSEAGELRAGIEFRARLLAWAALGLVISG